MASIDEFKKQLENREYREILNKELKKNKSDIKIIKNGEETWKLILAYCLFFMIILGSILTYFIATNKINIAKCSDITINEKNVSFTCPNIVCPAIPNCNCNCPSNNFTCNFPKDLNIKITNST